MNMRSLISNDYQMSMALDARFFSVTHSVQQISRSNKTVLFEVGKFRLIALHLVKVERPKTRVLLRSSARSVASSTVSRDWNL